MAARAGLAALARTRGRLGPGRLSRAPLPVDPAVRRPRSAASGWRRARSTPSVTRRGRVFPRRTMPWNWGCEASAPTSRCRAAATRRAAMCKGPSSTRASTSTTRPSSSWRWPRPMRSGPAIACCTRRTRSSDSSTCPSGIREGTVSGRAYPTGFRAGRTRTCTSWRLFWPPGKASTTTCSSCAPPKWSTCFSMSCFRRLQAPCRNPSTRRGGRSRSRRSSSSSPATMRSGSGFSPASST